jgi:hypothetical protein
MSTIFWASTATENNGLPIYTFLYIDTGYCSSDDLRKSGWSHKGSKVRGFNRSRAIPGEPRCLLYEWVCGNLFRLEIKALARITGSSTVSGSYELRLWHSFDIWTVQFEVNPNLIRVFEKP